MSIIEAIAKRRNRAACLLWDVALFKKKKKKQKHSKSLKVFILFDSHVKKVVGGEISFRLNVANKKN